MKTLLGLIAVATVLSGCGLWTTTEYASNDKSQYLKSKNGPDLVVPEPLTATNVSDFYRLPDQTKPAKVKIVPPTVKHHSSEE